MDFEEAISFDELYKGLMKSKRNVMWKDSVAGYYINRLKNTYRLRKDLLHKRYSLSQYQMFTITEPKIREIIATRIRDRQFQRSLCDNILYPDIVKRFIRDNCACQKNRGIDDALNRMGVHLRRYFLKNGYTGWVLQCDIRKYFPSIRYSVAQQILLEYVHDRDAAIAACEVIESFCYASILKRLMELGYNRREKWVVRLAHQLMLCRVLLVRIRLSNDGDESSVKLRLSALLNDVKEKDDLFDWILHHEFHGIGLGSQVSQIVALGMINKIDHYIKERLRVKCYIRYMDDFVLIHTDKAYLQFCRQQIERLLLEMGLTMNGKTHIYPLQHGITFLKWRFILTESGKIIRKMSDHSISKQRRKMRKFIARLQDGKMTMDDVYQSYQSWRANAERGDTKSIVHKMDLYFKELYQREWNQNEAIH